MELIWIGPQDIWWSYEKSVVVLGSYVGFTKKGLAFLIFLEIGWVVLVEVCLWSVFVFRRSWFLDEEDYLRVLKDLWNRKVI